LARTRRIFDQFGTAYFGGICCQPPGLSIVHRRKNCLGGSKGVGVSKSNGKMRSKKKVRKVRVCKKRRQGTHTNKDPENGADPSGIRGALHSVGSGIRPHPKGSTCD